VQRVAIPILLAVNFIVRAIVATRSLQYIDGLTIPDDAYICLTLARNIANGLGPWYGIDYTNGFQPLYVFLIAPVFWLFPNNHILPVHSALFLLILFDTATLYLLYNLVKRESISEATPVLIALAWILNPYSIHMSNNGMETSVAAFFVVAGLYYLRGLMLRKDFSSRKLAGLGAIAGLSMLARVDNVFLLVSFVIYLGIIWLREKIVPRMIAGKLATVILVALVVCLPWMIYQYGYAGGLIPVSGPAVRHMNLAAAANIPEDIDRPELAPFRAAAIIIRYNAIPLALIVGLAFLLFLSKITRPLLWQRLKGLIPILLYAVMLWAGYAFYTYGSWFYPRYLYPISILFILCLAIFLDSFIARMPDRFPRLAFGIVFVLFIAATTLVRPSLRMLYTSTDTTHAGYMNIGFWARDHFPDGTVIGSSQTGALGYFADNLTVVNLDGVVNRKCFEALKAGRNMEYIRETGIEYVIGWEVNINFIKWETADFRPDDLIPLGKVEGFQSWWFDWWLYKVNYREGKESDSIPVGPQNIAPE
jgi:hypothetical protein